MTTAEPTQQQQLLTVQALDTRLTQLAYKKTKLPEHAELEQVQRKADGLRDRLVAVNITTEDLNREISRLEGEVAQVQVRRDRDQKNLTDPNTPAKSLAALEADIAHLDRRISELEYLQLEAMENLEKAQASQTVLAKESDEVAASVAGATQILTKAQAALDAQFQSATAERNRAETEVPTDLMALYEQIREKKGGVGAAPLVGRRCEGCRIDLTEGELAVFREAPKNAVLHCEECGRILVRTEQSAL